MRKKLRKVSDASLLRRQRRKLSLRSKMSGTGERPRVCATRSNKHLRVQVINDDLGKTLFSIQTFGKDGLTSVGNNKDGAVEVGKKVAEKLKENNLSKAVFDRAGARYTGVMASIVDAMRENGIQV